MKDLPRGVGDRWQGRDYTPAHSDNTFFDWKGDGVSDHVGIVERADNNTTVYTIEGNTSDSVARRSYAAVGVKIMGYGFWITTCHKSKHRQIRRGKFYASPTVFTLRDGRTVSNRDTSCCCVNDCPKQAIIIWADISHGNPRGWRHRNIHRVIPVKIIPKTY